MKDRDKIIEKAVTEIIGDKLSKEDRIIPEHYVRVTFEWLQSQQEYASLLSGGVSDVVWIPLSEHEKITKDCRKFKAYADDGIEIPGHIWMRPSHPAPISEEEIDGLVDYFEQEVLFEDDSLEPFQRIQLANKLKNWALSKGAKPVSKWIKNKQPKIPKGVKDVEVLALNSDGLIIDCWFEEDWQFYNEFGENITDNVTHWMPLPESPKKLNKQ